MGEAENGQTVSDAAGSHGFGGCSARLNFRGSDIFDLWSWSIQAVEGCL